MNRRAVHPADPSTPARVGSRRGVVMVEATLVLLVLLMFLLLSPALFRMRMAEQQARIESHRDMFARASTFLNLPPLPNPPLFSPQYVPRAADIPDLDPDPVDTLDKYKSFANTTNEGREEVSVHYSVGWDMFRGVWTVQRRAYVIRPSWTWMGFPFSHTQDMVERGKIRDWYKQAYETPLDDSTVEALQVKKAPL